MMVIQYEDDSLRIVVSTANLIGSDWENRTQGLWVSPRCPKLSNQGDDDGDSPTGFKKSLLRYLKFYELTPLKQYIDAVKACDFSQVKAFFVSSVPNSHKGPDLNAWGHKQVGVILRKYTPADASAWPLVCQSSSIGSLGLSEGTWLRGDFGQSLMATAKFGTFKAPLLVIYPSKQNVFRSYDGVFGGGCLPYTRKTHEKQPWLRDFLHTWKADGCFRSKAMPHIKTYTRISPDNKRASYFLLSSANLSKAAWGTTNKAGDSLQIQSYEAGVLLLPKFVTGKDYFEIGSELKLPYDIPLQKYPDDHTCWFMEYLKEAMAGLG